MSKPAAQHIAVAIHSLAPDGGAQRRIVDLANRFDELGRRVDLLTLDAAGSLGDRLNPAVRLVGLGAFMRTPNLQAYARSARPDVIMSGVTVTHGLALAARAAADMPVVLRASRHPVRPFRRPLLDAVETAGRQLWLHRYARADAIVAVSRDVADSFRAMLPAQRIETILNPVVPATPVPVPRAPAIGVPLVLTAGRLKIQKDFATLLRAIALVRRTREVKLVILGEGSERSKLQALVSRLGLDAWVEMPGISDDVPGWMARASVFVSSSLWEGLPGVLVEALALGCPVVATDCPGGSREILADGRLGPLVPLRDPAALADAIVRVLATPPEPGELAAGAVPYLADGKAEQYLALFDDLVRSRRGYAAAAAPTAPATP